MTTQLTKIISLKYPSGSYTTRVYNFNDQHHFDNWYNLIVNKGVRVIGVEDE